MKEWSPENGLTEFEKMGGRDFEQMKVYTDKDRPPFLVIILYAVLPFLFITKTPPGKLLI
jgi:hypothetical protein